MNTAVTEAEAEALNIDLTLSLVLSSGMACKDGATGAAPPLKTLSNLTTKENVAKTELVRVEGCYRMPERMNMLDLVFPKDYYSSFTTLRRE